MDFLSICHFVIYFIFAYFYKDNFLLITIIGIAWEIFEYTITNVPVTRDFLIKYWPLRKKWMLDNNNINVPWKTEQIEDRIEDLIFNTLGYFCGNYYFNL